jgi:hypothetical protein
MTEKRSEIDINGFQVEERELFVSRFTFALKYLAVPLVLSFSAVDYYFRPDLLVQFLWARLLIIPTTMLVFALYRLKWVRNRNFYLPAHIFGLFTGTYHAYLCYLSGLEKSPYYAGMNLVAIGSLSWLPYNTKSLLICFAAIYLPYASTILLTGNRLDPSFLVPHFAFIVSTGGIGLITNVLTRRLRLNEFTSRKDLEHEILTKEDIMKMIS